MEISYVNQKKIYTCMAGMTSRPRRACDSIEQLRHRIVYLKVFERNANRIRQLAEYARWNQLEFHTKA